MKNINFLAIMVFSALFLSACLKDIGSSGLSIAASETDLGGTRSSSRTSGGKCEDDRDCIDVCEDVYDPDRDDENLGKVDTCLQVSYKLAIQFEDILEILEEPHESSLRNINNKAFFEFLDVSLTPWVEEVEDANDDEAKNLLIWIAKESKISSAIVEAYENYEREYDKFEGVAEMFDRIGNMSDCDNACEAVIQEAIVGSSTSFWDIAYDNGNSNAQCIVIELLEQKCDGVNFPALCSNIENSSC